MAADMPKTAFVPFTGRPTVTKQATQLGFILNELTQQQKQVNALLEQLTQVKESNEHLVVMQQMIEPTDPSTKEQSAWLRGKAEQEIISLAVLEGYLLQQREQLQRIKHELERLQADLAEEQRVLLLFQVRLEELPDASSRS